MRACPSANDSEKPGLGEACRAASAIAARAPGSRLRRALVLLGLIVMIVHCRPWSYTLFGEVGERHQVVRH